MYIVTRIYYNHKSQVYNKLRIMISYKIYYFTSYSISYNDNFNYKESISHTIAAKNYSKYKPQ